MVRKYLVFVVAVPATRGGRGRGPPVRGPCCPGVGRGDVGGGAGRPRLAAVAVLAAGPVLLLGKEGWSRDFMQSGEDEDGFDSIFNSREEVQQI